MIKKSLFLTIILFALNAVFATPLVYEGEEGPGKGKHIVFIANDHEYRSEESCPLLAKLLAKNLGFKCTVLFGIDENGHILPGAASIPNLEVLEEADLAFFFTRFMNLPEEEVQHIANYLERGAPVIGVRTSSHSFYGQEGKYSIFNYDYKGEDYEGGFGKQVLGNTWDKTTGQSHYGSNHSQGGLYTPEAGAESHPVWTGVESFHGYNGAYKSQPQAEDTPIVKVQVLNTFQASDNYAKNKPLVNAGWTRDSYTAPSGEKKDGRVFYTSIGPSEDLLDPGARRFLMNACMWAVGLEDQISAETSADIVGTFEPSAYFNGALYRAGVKPVDLAGFDSAIMPMDALFSGVKDAPEKCDPKFARVFANRKELLEKVKTIHPQMIAEFGNAGKRRKK